MKSDKLKFEELDNDLQQQIMYELCDIGQESKFWSEIVEIEAEAFKWLRENNEPKDYDEWREAVLLFKDKKYEI